jgi:hypothetical protein
MIDKAIRVYFEIPLFGYLGQNLKTTDRLRDPNLIFGCHWPEKLYLHMGGGVMLKIRKIRKAYVDVRRNPGLCDNGTGEKRVAFTWSQSCHCAKMEINDIKKQALTQVRWGVKKWTPSYSISQENGSWLQSANQRGGRMQQVNLP